MYFENFSWKFSICKILLALKSICWWVQWNSIQYNNGPPKECNCASVVCFFNCLYILSYFSLQKVILKVISRLLWKGDPTSIVLYHHDNMVSSIFFILYSLIFCLKPPYPFVLSHEKEFKSNILVSNVFTTKSCMMFLISHK